MDIQLPDGRIVRNVPDGLSREELAAGLRERGIHIALPQQETPGEGFSGAVKDAAQTILKNWINQSAGAVRGTTDLVTAVAKPLDKKGRDEWRAQIDAGLQSLTGADPHSLAYGGGRFMGNLAGTAGVGSLLGTGLKAAPMVPAPLIKAIETAGFRTGLNPTTFGGKAIDMATRMGGGAVTGGATAAAIEPEALKQGAVIGALLPPAVKAVGYGAQQLGNALRHTVAMFSDDAAKSVAAADLADKIGQPNVRQAIGDLQTYYPKGAESIPMSGAAIVQQPKLTQAELGSRIHSNDLWTDFDVKQARAVWENVKKATAEADNIKDLIKARDANWKLNWASAAANKQPRNFSSLMGQFKLAMDRASISPDSSNPQVLNLLKEIDQEVVRLGKAFDIGHLQQIRANLNGEANPTSQNIFQSVDRKIPAVISLKQELDDILNQSTKGKFQKVIAGYAEDSAKLNAAQGAKAVRGKFLSPDTGVLMKNAADLAGDIPSVTQAGLRGAIEEATLAGRGSVLSEDGLARLIATQDAIKRQEGVRLLKKAATAGAGSDTAANLLSIAAPSKLQGLLNLGRSLGRGKVDAAKAGLLMHPDDLALALEQYLAKHPQSTLANSVLAGLPYRAAPLLMNGQ